jgi:hypothetical protein
MKILLIRLIDLWHPLPFCSRTPRPLEFRLYRERLFWLDPAFLVYYLVRRLNLFARFHQFYFRRSRRRHRHEFQFDCFRLVALDRQALFFLIFFCLFLHNFHMI